MINPINTESQIQHELEALEIFNLKEIQQQKDQVRNFWLDLVKPSEVMLSCFEDAFEEPFYYIFTFTPPLFGPVPCSALI